MTTLAMGAWLKKRRRRLDLTQDDLAKQAYCSVNAIRRIESGDLMPSRALAAELARALAIPETHREEFIALLRTPDAQVTEDAFGATSPLSPTPIHFVPPAPLTSLIGREHDLGVVTRLFGLPQTRLVTLTGPPGTGKTRLSLEVANGMAGEFANGAVFVPLAPIAEAARVEGAVAQELGLRETGNVAAFLRGKELLLVLDNFEHVLEAAPLVSALIASAPRVKILVTSRETLHISHETEYPLAPLDVPPEAASYWRDLETYSAVQLLVERARQVRPDFVLTPGNASAVAQLCVALDGLPLALEMAASHLRDETPRQLLSLVGRLNALENRARDLEARQRTLRGALDWSYERLDTPTQALLSALGMFRGGFSAEAARAVCETGTAWRLDALVEKSLVKRQENFGAHARYNVLEMVREYALEQLARRDQTAVVRARHAAYYRAHVHAIARVREFGTQGEWLRYDARDAENFRMALEWYAEHDVPAAVEFAADLTEFRTDRGVVGEALEFLAGLVVQVRGTLTYLSGLHTLAELSASQGKFERAQEYVQEIVALTPDAPITKARASAWHLSGFLAMMRGEFLLAQDYLLRALTAFQTLQLRAYEARVLSNLGLVAKDRVELERATEYHLAALALRRELGLQAEIGQSLFNLAIVAYWRKDYAGAIRMGSEAYTLRMAEGNFSGAGYVLETIGMAHFNLGQYNEAIQALQSSLGMLRRTDDQRGLALILNSLGDVALAQQDYKGARQFYREALQLCQDTGEKRRVAFCLEGSAAALLHLQYARRAVTLLGAADALREQSRIPMYEADRAAHATRLNYAHEKLDDEEFAAAWLQGRALDWSNALALALV